MTDPDWKQGYAKTGGYSPRLLKAFAAIVIIDLLIGWWPLSFKLWIASLLYLASLPLGFLYFLAAGSSLMWGPLNTPEFWRNKGLRFAGVVIATGVLFGACVLAQSAGLHRRMLVLGVLATWTGLVATAIYHTCQLI